jgi:hypothetical protein
MAHMDGDRLTGWRLTAVAVEGMRAAQIRPCRAIMVGTGGIAQAMIGYVALLINEV